MEGTNAKDTSDVELGNDDQLANFTTGLALHAVDASELLHACPPLLHQLQGFIMTITTHKQLQEPLEDFQEGRVITDEMQESVGGVVLATPHWLDFPAL